MERIRKFFKDEDGVTSLEYSLIAVVTCLAIIGALVLIKPRLTDIWNQIAGALV